MLTNAERQARWRARQKEKSDRIKDLAADTSSMLNILEQLIEQGDSEGAIRVVKKLRLRMNKILLENR